MTEPIADERHPLAGLKVLDLATLIAAPLSTTLLGDFGADVIKVERPGGDDARRFGMTADREPVAWKTSGRNKRSIELDLHDPDAVEVVLRLVEEVDVVVTNFRLPTLRGWGLDYPQLVARKPDVIMMHLTAFGRTGPWSDKPGFARIAEAFSGIPHITGHADGAPLYLGYPISDAIGGLYGAFSLMLAVRHRDLTGEGQLIDLGLYEPVVRLIEDMYTIYSASGDIKTRMGNDQMHSCPNGVFPTADDRWVAIAATTSNMWQRLKGILDEPELDRFDDRVDRVANRRYIDEVIENFTRGRTHAELVEIFERHELAGALIMHAGELVEHPQVEARGNFVHYHDAEFDRDLAIQAPLPTMSRSLGSIRRHAPLPGEHTEEILRGLGYSDADIEGLRSTGVT